ncbi:hypothetical protein MHM84_03330 [Halomonas sp. McH1-25]|uniref:hypothetical protein n=1 Tax=unclassified Halomonas TaxID=2609666 RepID=UPI001EF687B4|nr:MULTISPECIES: hypothetical protein [unclassified Halomonas]MCG7598807.1 hypothetical protein [Halomonas sp. McH1-25]MCP1340770.1 hypothetical protein [Halomonas sp. FL8]MCP1362193.1 hypothetical protein [Halomonas sp. BBD45]MCP1365769.1 hypothetical protein [Halomonas sp. BBD48]
MFNISREVACPHCSVVNCWEINDPQPDDELTCTGCRRFISSHEDYIYGLVKQEVSRTMQRYAHCNVSRDLSLLKLALMGDVSPPVPEMLRY